MPLILNEEQMLLKNTAKELFSKKGSIETLRRLRDSKDKIGLDKSLWMEMGAAGWTALVIPEDYFGLDFGYVGLGQILEESGRTLTPSPLISTVLLSTTAVIQTGNEEQKKRLLTAIAEGALIVAFANEEGRHHKPALINTSLSKDGDNYILNGKKTFVLDGHIADKIVVVAKDEAGKIALAVVNADLAGIHIERTAMMDNRNAAKITFDQVKVQASDVLNSAEDMSAAYHKILDIGRIGLAAEMLGSMQEAFERANEYIKTREQFGLRIGSFQGLQHRAAEMFCEIEVSKSIVLKALNAIDEDSDKLALLASHAKAKIGETFKVISNEAIQFYGGIGMTDDEEIGFFLKRARVAQRTLGDYNFHLDRYASLRAY